MPPPDFGERAVCNLQRAVEVGSGCDVRWFEGEVLRHGADPIGNARQTGHEKADVSHGLVGRQVARGREQLRELSKQHITRLEPDARAVVVASLIELLVIGEHAVMTTHPARGLLRELSRPTEFAQPVPRFKSCGHAAVRHVRGPARELETQLPEHVRLRVKLHLKWRGGLSEVMQRCEEDAPRVEIRKGETNPSREPTTNALRDVSLKEASRHRCDIEQVKD